MLRRQIPCILSYFLDFNKNEYIKDSVNMSKAQDQYEYIPNMSKYE